jgi:hypothetical protein
MSVITAKKAATVDFSIVGAVLAIATAASLFFVSSLPEYENPAEITVEIALVNDFVADYSYSGATLTQDEETGVITAVLEGEVVGEMDSNYLSLEVSEKAGQVVYTLTERVTTK